MTRDAPEPVLVLGRATGRILAANRAALEALGFESEADAKARRVLELSQQLTPDKWERAMARLGHQNCGEVKLELRLPKLKRPGSLSGCWVTLSLHLSGTGNGAELVGLLTRSSTAPLDAAAAPNVVEERPSQEGPRSSDEDEQSCHEQRLRCGKPLKSAGNPRGKPAPPKSCNAVPGTGEGAGPYGPGPAQHGQHPGLLMSAGPRGPQTREHSDAVGSNGSVGAGQGGGVGPRKGLVIHIPTSAGEDGDSVSDSDEEDCDAPIASPLGFGGDSMKQGGSFPAAPHPGCSADIEGFPPGGPQHWPAVPVAEGAAGATWAPPAAGGGSPRMDGPMQSEQRSFGRQLSSPLARRDVHMKVLRSPRLAYASPDAWEAETSTCPSRSASMPRQWGPPHLAGVGGQVAVGGTGACGEAAGAGPSSSSRRVISPSEFALDGHGHEVAWEDSSCSPNGYVLVEPEDPEQAPGASTDGPLTRMNTWAGKRQGGRQPSGTAPGVGGSPMALRGPWMPMAPLREVAAQGGQGGPPMAGKVGPGHGQGQGQPPVKRTVSQGPSTVPLAAPWQGMPYMSGEKHGAPWGVGQPQGGVGVPPDAAVPPLRRHQSWREHGAKAEGSPFKRLSWKEGAGAGNRDHPVSWKEGAGAGNRQHPVSWKEGAGAAGAPSAAGSSRRLDALGAVDWATGSQAEAAAGGARGQGKGAASGERAEGRGMTRQQHSSRHQPEEQHSKGEAEAEAEALAEVEPIRQQRSRQKHEGQEPRAERGLQRQLSCKQKQAGQEAKAEKEAAGECGLERQLSCKQKQQAGLEPKAEKEAAGERSLESQSSSRHKQAGPAHKAQTSSESGSNLGRQQSQRQRHEGQDEKSELEAERERRKGSSSAKSHKSPTNYALWALNAALGPGSVAASLIGGGSQAGQSGAKEPAKRRSSAELSAKSPRAMADGRARSGDGGRCGSDSSRAEQRRALAPATLLNSAGDDGAPAAHHSPSSRHSQAPKQLNRTESSCGNGTPAVHQAQTRHRHPLQIFPEDDEVPHAGQGARKLLAGVQPKSAQESVRGGVASPEDATTNEHPAPDTGEAMTPITPRGRKVTFAEDVKVRKLVRQKSAKWPEPAGLPEEAGRAYAKEAKSPGSVPSLVRTFSWNERGDGKAARERPSALASPRAPVVRVVSGSKPHAKKSGAKRSPSLR